ncbi:hypothetical protein ACH5RR_015795 [Cinchona calisaya]|uniref:Uncharacterized protein n=1 Tax=Cinchona calisaya TaxID=153742 RepID=A0ABD2ZU35_9GENT
MVFSFISVVYFLKGVSFFLIIVGLFFLQFSCFSYCLKIIICLVLFCLVLLQLSFSTRGYLYGILPQTRIKSREVFLFPIEDNGGGVIWIFLKLFGMFCPILL